MNLPPDSFKVSANSLTDLSLALTPPPTNKVLESNLIRFSEPLTLGASPSFKRMKKEELTWLLSIG